VTHALLLDFGRACKPQWEVWYGEPKADNIVSLGVGRYS
jgi:hypothetical protein